MGLNSTRNPWFSNRDIYSLLLFSYVPVCSISVGCQAASEGKQVLMRCVRSKAAAAASVCHLRHSKAMQAEGAGAEHKIWGGKRGQRGMVFKEGIGL
eukprot:32607-Pelagomonas_calceolata.AAC.1